MTGSILPIGKRIIAVVAVGLTATAAHAQSVRYVDDDAPLGGDGLSWTTPHKYLQDGLFAAASDPTITEMRVADGHRCGPG